jgi:predicted nucleotide-binding protein (sugar kinase/HSP70/actin superfamily)
VNNDACYPSILVTGQLIGALKSGKYDPNKTALFITQTGGGCRATNYIGFIRKALNDNGWSHVPVIGASIQALERNPGFKISLSLLHRVLMGMVYGDILMQILYRTRPYEKVAGSANELYEHFNKKCVQQLKSLNPFGFSRLCREMIEAFDNLPLADIRKPRVGVVGEVLVKYHPTANTDIVKVIENEGAEAVVPDLTDFFAYCTCDGDVKHRELSQSWFRGKLAHFLIWYLELYRKQARESFRKSKRFSEPHSILDLAETVDGLVQLGNVMGEGWLLTAEMLELIKQGVTDIACLQPFACLPNHITGKGVFRELRRRYPESNIAGIDYDPGASEVNQLNRLKLLLANAKPGRHPDEPLLSSRH